MGGCTAAVVAGKARGVRSEAMPRGQAEHLVPFAQEALAQAAIGFECLDAVLCTIGPGAFTGIRIGLSAARAFGSALQIPVIGVTTTQALALEFSERENKPSAVLLETKRSDFYVQLFDDAGGTVGEARALDVSEIDLPEEYILIGDGVERFLGKTGLEKWKKGATLALPDMSFCALYLQTHGVSGGIFLENPQPVYLRGADVSQPKVPPRKIETA